MFLLAFGAVFHAVAGAFDDDGVAVVEEAVEDGGGDGGVAVEDGGPLFVGFVGGEDDGAAFVAGADDLEEEVGSVLVDGEVADFIKDEEGGGGVFAHFGFEAADVLGGAEGVDDVDGVGEEDAVALLAGGVAKGGGKVGFAKSDEADEDEVGFVADELEAKEVLDLQAVDFFGPVPAEGFEGFDDGEAGGLEATGDGAVGTQVGFAFDELAEVVEVGEGVFGGGGGEGLAVFFDEGEAQGVEMGVEDVRGGGGALHGGGRLVFL